MIINKFKNKIFVIKAITLFKKLLKIIKKYLKFLIIMISKYNLLKTIEKIVKYKSSKSL
jgi:hypothetical protein